MEEPIELCYLPVIAHQMECPIKDVPESKFLTDDQSKVTCITCLGYIHS